jgi:leucyl aminopeptidase
MTTPITLSFIETDLDALAGTAGNLAVIVPPEGKLDPAGRRLNRLTKGAIARLAAGGAVRQGQGGRHDHADLPGRVSRPRR